MVFGLSACGEEKETELVHIGDSVITQTDLDQYIEFAAFLQGVDLEQIPEDSLATIKQQMLEDMISLDCIEQYYAGKEAEILPDTVEEDLQSFLDEAKSTDTVSDYLTEKNISDETLTKFYYDQYYKDAYLKEVQAGMSDLEQQAQDYYTANKESFKVDEVTASHILLEDEALANEILDKIKAGADFAALAKEYSIDTGTKDNGGSLGSFGRGKMVTEFENAAFALEPGEVSDVVQTQYGYHIIKVTDKENRTKTYEDVRDDIISTIVNTEAQVKIQELESTMDIEYLTDDYAPKAK